MEGDAREDFEFILLAVDDFDIEMQMKRLAADAKKNKPQPKG